MGYRDGKVRKIVSALDALRDDLGIDERLEIAAALEDWEDIAGARISPHVKPLRVKDRVLYVQCDGSAWMQEFNFIRGDVIRKINEKLGRPIVKDIRFRN